MRPHPLRTPCPVLPSLCPGSRQTSVFGGVHPEPKSSIPPGAPTPAGPRCSDCSQDLPSVAQGPSHGPRPPNTPCHWQILEPGPDMRLLGVTISPLTCVLLGQGGGVCGGVG